MENNDVYLPLNNSDIEKMKEIERKEKCQNCATLTFCYISGFIIVGSIVVGFAVLIAHLGNL